MCKMRTSPGVFFNFFLILVFGAVRRVKVQKIAQNEIAYVTHHILRTVYSI